MLKFFREKGPLVRFLRRRRERARRVDACLEKLADWSIEDLEDGNKRIGMLTLIPGEDTQIVNLTWMELPVETETGAIFSAAEWASDD